MLQFQHKEGVVMFAVGFLRPYTIMITMAAAALVLQVLATPQNVDGTVWPSFRGDHAAGVADNQNLPQRWDGEKGLNIRWKTAIPGLGHSSPAVWNNSVFVTTAVSSRNTATFKRGLYGDGDASDDRSVHQWRVYSLDRFNRQNPVG